MGNGGGVGFNVAGNQELYFGNVKFEILVRHPPWGGSTRQGMGESGGQDSTLAVFYEFGTREAAEMNGIPEGRVCEVRGA